MVKIKQSGAIVTIISIIILAYYIFDQKDLINVTEIAQYKCLQNSQINPNLCISCITRKTFNVAQQSSVYVKDMQNGFRIIISSFQGYVSCQQILHFVDYQNGKMQNSKDIKFQKLAPIRDIEVLLEMQNMEGIYNKFQAPKNIATIAIFQIKKDKNAQSTIFTFSSVQSSNFAREFGKLLSQLSLIASICCLLYFRFKQDMLKIGYIGVICINFMVLAEAILGHSQYLIGYASSLAIGYFYSKIHVSRYLCLIAIVLSIATNTYIPVIYSQVLAVILGAYILTGASKNFKRIGTLGIFSILSIIICSGFKGHHHILSLPLRMIIEYTILSMSPLLMELVNKSDGYSYDILPSSSKPSTSKNVTLPGFEEEDEISDEQDEEQRLDLGQQQSDVILK